MEDVIVWEAPARCPGPAVVRATVARLLRASEGRPAYQAEARVSEEGDGFTLKLSVTVGDAAGERTLRGPSCDALAEAAATIVALAVDPDGVARLPASPAASVAPLVLAPLPPPATAAPVEPSSPGPPPAPTPVGAEAPGYRGTAGALLAVELGLLPSATPLFGASGSVRRGPLAFVLWAAAGTPQNPRTASGAGAEVSAAMIGASACRGLFSLPIGVGPCIGVSAARVAGGGFGAGISPRATSKVLVRAELGAEAVIERRFLGARLAAFATVPTQRPPFVVGAGEELFTPSIVGGRGEISLFLRF